MNPLSASPATSASGLAVAALAALLLPLADPTSASTIGSVANFDAVNDTGKPAYGFEIEIEDPLFDRSKIYSTFGYDRNFGGNPLSVVRFGHVEFIDLLDASNQHRGVLVRYGGVAGSGIFTPANDPAAPFNTPGESCWPGANANWQANPCDHYGISTYGTPAKTTYYWLTLDGSGSFVRQVAGIPAVNYVYTPPQQNQPAAVVARIAPVAVNREQPENEALWGDPFWVKVTKTKVDRIVDLGDLLVDHKDGKDNDIEKAEVEVEWKIFQLPPAGKADGREVMESPEIEFGAGEKAVMRRYEFYRYAGPLNIDGSGETDCNDDCELDPLGLDASLDHFGTSYVGNYVGQQMAGFNLDVPAPVPEPQTWALMLAGLAVVGSLARRRH